LTALRGSSGSGKSTLLNAAAGLVVATRGTVSIGSEDLSAMSQSALARLRRRRVGIVFQAGHLLSELSGVDNVALPVRLLGGSRRLARARASSLLDQLGLGALAGKFPAELSGGQRQRLAVARAVVHRPALVLADEPTGSLDRKNADAVVALLFASVRAVGGALVLATHDGRLAAECERIVTLADGEIVSDSATVPGLMPTRDAGS
jgi:putative ABC transport system ATP-binding protein